MIESVIIDTKSGKLEGSIRHSFEGYDYYAFRGIPFAEPPVGELRFKDPVPVKPWQGVKKAIKYGMICGQTEVILDITLGGEDCLTLNIFTKEIKPSEPLPVMVWIHGGAYLFGSGNDLFYGPDYMLRKDVILITLNYRLGVLGFLDLDDEVAPGNQGLKDQVMALRWVKENIASFGGDPDKITVFGESAGATSVHWLTISPLAKGLFNRIILESGSATNTWAHNSNSVNSYKLCNMLGNNSKDPKVLVKFLRSIELNKLIETQDKVRRILTSLQLSPPFFPGVDSESKTPLSTVNPVDAIEKNASHYPCLLGYNSREGIFIVFNMQAYKYDFKQADKEFDKMLTYRAFEVMRKNNITIDQMKRLYFGNEKISMKNSDKLANLFGDMTFVQGIHEIVQSQVKYSSEATYFYRFDYDKEFSLLKEFGNMHNMSGTAHFDEIPYLFSSELYRFFDFPPHKPGSTGYRIMDQMTELWTNFAKYGTPTPEISDLLPVQWLPVTDEKVFSTFVIDTELRMDKTVNFAERIKNLK